MKRSLVVFFALAILAGCASMPDLPPKSGPEEVELYNERAGIYPPDGYRIIEEIIVVGPSGDTPLPEMERLLLTEAARLGADAVLWQGFGLHTLNRNDPEEQTTRLRARGIAIYWP